MLNIILEGVDKCGKTTLARKLRDDFKFKVVKCSQPKGDPYVEYLTKLRAIKQNTVFDRFHLGEMVYGPIYRGSSKIDEEKQRNIELLAMSRNTIIIYCFDDEGKIRRRFKELKETYAQGDKVSDMLTRYFDVVSKSNLEVIPHQINSDLDLTKGDRLRKVILQHENKYLTLYDDIIGNTSDPKFILVGDERNQRNNHYNEVGQPFDFGKAANYLFKSLRQQDIPLNQVALANSDSKHLVTMAHDQLFNSKNFIALGKNSCKRLCDLDLKHVHEHHPSFERRFNSKTNEFGKRLKLRFTYGHLR